MADNLRIIMAQIDLLVGAIEQNTDKIIEFCHQARDTLHGDIIVFPELSLTAYPPEDLLLRPEFYKHIDLAIEKLKQSIHGIAALISFPEITDQGVYNSAALFYNGEILAKHRKHCLPNYGVFDEKRYFIPGNDPTVFNFKGVTIGITICEDLWFPQPMAKAAAAGAQLILCPNASPYDLNKPMLREDALRKRVRAHPIPIVYVHWLSGQDEIVFDGGSIVMDKDGTIGACAGYFNETLHPVDFTIQQGGVTLIRQELPKKLSHEEALYKALVLGIKDYVNKNHFKGAIIALSGGIDSALTAALAVDALGKERVKVILMPSRYSAAISIEDAKVEAELLGIEHHLISIEPNFQSFLTSLADVFAGLPEDTTEENIQARCRGVIQMALSNKFGYIVLTTGNKSEMAVGYATLYGDMAGGFCVLKDVPKTWVYKLANYRNQISPVIPQRVIDRPPSAELAPNQLDQNTLPPYPILDQILERYVEKDEEPETIIQAGFDRDTVIKVIKMVNRNEYKRRQAPPGIRITSKAFGKDRRYPITSGFHQDLT